MALANLAIIQLQVMSKVGPTSRLANTIMNVLRVLCVVMVPIAAYAPAVSLKTFFFSSPTWPKHMVNQAVIIFVYK